MQTMGAVATKIPNTVKLMLTCFTSNQKAIAFYEKLGYSKDEFSPTPKLLRNGTRVEPDYVILSKVLLDPSSSV
jgi:RimJ/RimL family protein N-acetyltransferase